MATNTPTFDFDREDPGADGWTDRINGNFTDIDTLLSGGSANGETASMPGVEFIEDGATPSDIDTACANNNYVLAVDGTFTGSTTITVPNETKLVLFGSTLDYTGTNEAIVLQGGSGQDPRPRPMLFGGTISGNDDADAGVVVRDTYGSVVKYVEIHDFTGAGTGRGAGYALENVDAFSEENELSSFALADNRRAIEFRGADATGGTGTQSFKATRVFSGHIESGTPGEDAIYVNGGVYDSMIRDIGLNMSDDTNMLNMQTTPGDLKIQELRGEAQGSTGAYVINYGANSGQSPALIDVTLAGSTGYVRNNPNNVTTLRKEYQDNGTENLLSGTDAVGGHETDTYSITLDGTDSTTWVDVADVNRTAMTVKAVDATAAAGVWAFAAAGDFANRSDADGVLNKSNPTYELNARVDSSTLQISSAASGQEGAAVEVSIESLSQP